jgi:hypothetical protein
VATTQVLAKQREEDAARTIQERKALELEEKRARKLAEDELKAAEKLAREQERQRVKAAADLEKIQEKQRAKEAAELEKIQEKARRKEAERPEKKAPPSKKLRRRGSSRAEIREEEICCNDCGGIDVGSWVRCDNSLTCDKWYKLCCLGLEHAPLEADWYCCAECMPEL